MLFQFNQFFKCIEFMNDDKPVICFWKDKKNLDSKFKHIIQRIRELSILNGDDMEKVVALKEYEKLIEAPLKAKIEEDKPKVDYFENFMNSNRLFTSTQVAKLYGLSSGQKLNKLL